MSTAALANGPTPSPLVWSTPVAQAVQDLAQRSVDELLAVCRQFLVWHREGRVLRDAPLSVCLESDRAHAWLLRATRTLQNQMLDPDFPHRELARKVETTIWQLEEAWAQAHNPMPEAEVDTHTARLFPADAPGA